MSHSSFQATFFSPLGKEYCLYFYFLAIVALVLILLKIVHIFYNLFSKKGKDGSQVAADFIVFISLILSYFVNRLLYSMCVGSLK